MTLAVEHNPLPKTIYRMVLLGALVTGGAMVAVSVITPYSLPVALGGVVLAASAIALRTLKPDVFFQSDVENMRQFVKNWNCNIEIGKIPLHYWLDGLNLETVGEFRKLAGEKKKLEIETLSALDVMLDHAERNANPILANMIVRRLVEKQGHKVELEGQEFTIDGNLVEILTAAKKDVTLESNFLNPDDRKLLIRTALALHHKVGS